MKIKITTTNDVIGNIINSSAEIKSYYTDSSVKEISEDMDKKLMGVDVRKNFAGGFYSYKCAPSYEEYGKVEFNMNLDDNAFIMALKVGTKIAKILSPLYDMGKSMIKLAGNICNEIKDLTKRYDDEYNERFGLKPTYAVFTVKEKDLEAGDVVIMKNDGYENDDSIQIAHVYHYWTENDLDVLNKIIKAKYHNRLTFDIMSEQEAFKVAETMGCTVEKSVENMSKACQDHHDAQ